MPNPSRFAWRALICSQDIRTPQRPPSSPYGGPRWPPQWPPVAGPKRDGGVVERDDQILHALREKDRTVQGLVEFTGIAESTVKRAIRELRSRGEVVLNADGTFRI